MIEKQELKFVLGTMIFGILWVIGIIGFLSTSEFFLSLNPIVQYILFNIGYIVLSISVFGTILCGRTEFDLFKRIVKGLSVFLIFSLVFDLWSPPYAYSLLGEGLSESAVFGNSMLNTASDYVVGWVWQELGFTVDSLFGVLPISSVFILTYILTPILTILIIAFILSPKQVSNIMTSGMNVSTSKIRSK